MYILLGLLSIIYTRQYCRVCVCLCLMYVFGGSGVGLLAQPNLTEICSAQTPFSQF